MSPVWTPEQKPPDRTALSCPSHDALIVLRALREAYKKKREDTYQIKTEGNSKSSGKYYETLYKKQFGTYNAAISSVSCDAVHDRNMDDLGIRIKEEPINDCDPSQGFVKNVCRDGGEVYSQNASRQNRLDFAAGTIAGGKASLTMNPAMSSLGMHSYVPTSGMNSFVPTSGMHLYVPTTGMHSFVPTLGSDSCVPTNLDLQTSGMNAYVPTSGEPVTSQICSSVPACPPLSISDDSDIEPCSVSSDSNRFNRTTVSTTSNRNSLVCQGEIQEPQSSCINSSEQYFSASTNLQHNFSENHSSLNLAPGVKHQANIKVLGHGNHERNPLGGSTQTLAGLEEPKARSKKVFSGGSQRPAYKTGLHMSSLSKHLMRNKNPVEKEKIPRTSRDCSSIVVTSIRPKEIALIKRTKRPRSIYDSLSRSTEKGEVQVFDRKACSVQDKEYVRCHDIEGVTNNKQKTRHTQKGFQVPVKKFKAVDQLTLHQSYARKLPSVYPPKDLIDVLKADDSRRQQVACQINKAKTVALTLVYSDCSTQLSGAATKTKSSKLHADDKRPVAVILVAMAVEEESKQHVFVHVPLYSHVSIVDEWIRKLFQDLMSNRSISKVCFGAQKLMHVLLELYTFNSREVCSKWQVDDPKLAAWLLDADHCPHTFTELSETICIQQAPSDSKGRYKVCDDLLHMLEVMIQLRRKLEESCLLQLYKQVEVKLIPILAVMETLGISIDTKLLLQYGKTLQEKINEVEKEAMDMVGYSFNINSNPQLRQVLFDELKLDEKYKQSKGKALARTAVLQSKSTSESVLLKLKPFHGLPSLILEYRQLVKVKSTFIDGILEKIENGMLHTCWDQTAASSGRLTSTNPNIQNIPKKVLMNAMKDESAIEGSVVTIKPREGFKAAVGKMLIAADFQSIELRLLAHLSQDASLLAVFNNPGVADIFVELTTHWLGIQKENVTPMDRDRTKRIVYSVFYGAGTERLSETLSVTTTQAKELRSSFLAKFPQVKQFTADCIRKCCKQGFVETIFHRRRLLPNIKSANFHDRSFAERQAVNFVVQGSAADICKSAMIDVVSELASRPDLKTQLLVQIHDELLLESPDEEVNTVTELLESVMECTTHLCSSFTTLTVPIPVSITVGKTWGDMVPWRKYTTTK
ncbi:DNA polymerase nu-like isoform X2 [Anneissia japonica]|uniref:DNA polymerase nu-like isoform X2 n=1 Tax=Anneissia japonica TaxID=1529436 RepID=UPI0014259429|nr:DNA polymerase nu-like isoform X2 [Anneissia japonica]